MLGGISEVLVSRFPFVAGLLAVVVVFTVTACDDGGSSKKSTSHRSTTTSSSSTTTSATSSSSTSPSVPSTPPSSTAESIGACGNQTDAIVAAIQGSDVGGIASRQGQYTIHVCRLAASSPIWAAADVVPDPGQGVDRATVVLQRIGALWNVMDVGTAQVGCDDAPANVIADLELVCG
jgi:cytoskeletal protein RodZ